MRGPDPGGAGHPECPRGGRGPRLHDWPGPGETAAGPQARTGRGRAGPGHRRNEATGPLRARDVCDALDHELLPKNIEGTRAKLKRLVKLDVLSEVDAGSVTGKQ
ncbi:hypothetical protein GZL_01639 [Streptomyces sp. 769]|nr:hypothetical protein GZL_01639 [Streptomyces sp. 769]